MKIFQKDNVYTEALKRIEFLYNEFSEVTVASSGGKDSTVIINLCLEVARKLNRLPVRVMFIDQEVEWEHTVEYMRETKSNPDIDMRWYQMPIKISNSTSHTEDWLQCWKENDEWVREKELNAITKNIYGTDRFNELFTHIINTEYKGRKACLIGGVRAEENPKRALGLTVDRTYKWVTWGKFFDKKDEHFVFYPIYDWSFTDIWHYIFSKKVNYNKIYNYMYAYGESVSKMRVSNLNHETAIHSLTLLQEIEPDNWNKVSKRIVDANVIKHIRNSAMTCPKELPYMFKDWKEYRDYLLNKMVVNPVNQEKMAKTFQRMDKRYEEYPDMLAKAYKVQITTIIINDYSLTKVDNFEVTAGMEIKLRKKYGKVFKKY
jgi:predicted phosphoadenosine phosphosulfate sulfurtransferase